MAAPVMDRFSALREALPARDVLEHYGFHVNRRQAVCPFHADTHPSLHVYPGTRGWHCFACGAGGDVIDFAARLFRLQPLGAARRLDADFGLGLFDGPRPSREKVLELQRSREAKAKALEAFRAEYMDKVREIRALHHLVKGGPAPYFAGEYALLLGHLEWLEWWFQENRWR